MKTIGRNMENVYKALPKECLPIEYLPDDYKGKNAGTLQTVIGMKYTFILNIFYHTYQNICVAVDPPFHW